MQKAIQKTHVGICGKIGVKWPTDLKLCGLTQWNLTNLHEKLNFS